MGEGIKEVCGGGLRRTVLAVYHIFVCTTFG